MPDFENAGLTSAWPNLLNEKLQATSVADLPPALLEFLADLRLLKGVPLRYIVPDGAWLPLESIRFFHVDPNWTDRLVDGVFSAGSVGSADQVFAARVLERAREQVDACLGLRLLKARGAPIDDKARAGAADTWQKVTLTGLILRSELVQRWPGLEVRAFYNTPRKDPPLASNQIATLRVERLGGFILIALFAGVPDRVELVEPMAGVRLRLSVWDAPRARTGAAEGVQDVQQSAQSATPPHGPAALAEKMLDPPFVAVFEGADNRETMLMLRVQVKEWKLAKIPGGGGA